jgi:hypothetical protein
MKIAAVLSLLLAALPARSQEERKFGDPGVVVPSGSLSLGSVSGTTVVDLEPALQFFTAPNVAFGLSLIYFHASNDVASTSIYGLAPSLGYNLRLGDVLSIFPQASLPLQVLAPTGGSNRTIIGAGLFVPVLIHPVRHFFIGFGPDFQISGRSDDLFSDRALIVRTVIGGWL